MKSTSNSFVALGMWSEVKPREMETQQLFSPSTEVPGQRSILVQGILTKTM
jgi:hypothetical protein